MDRWVEAAGQWEVVLCSPAPEWEEGEAGLEAGVEGKKKRGGGLCLCLLFLVYLICFVFVGIVIAVEAVCLPGTSGSVCFVCCAGQQFLFS